MIASANRVVQDPGSVGAALRTISLRLRGTSTKELEEAGEDTTGVVESKSKLRTKVKSLTGVDILTDTGAYRSTYDILLDISKVWKDISDIDQAALLEVIAGKTRSNTAAAILSNTKDLEEALLAAQEAEGSALRENEKYLDSIQGKIDQFNNAVQTMWSNTLDDDMVKGVVELGTELVKIVDNFGLIKTLVMAIGTFLIQKNFKGDLFGGLFSTQNLEDARVKLQSLKAEYEKAQQAYDANHTGANKRYLDSTKKTYEKYDGKVSPLIKEYDELNNKLSILQEKRQSLVNDMSNSQAHEDFLGKKMAAGYDISAKSIDNARASTARLKGQIQQVDQEIANTETALQNVQHQAQQTGIAGATAGQKIKAGFKLAKTEIVKFGKQMLSSMAYMYVFTTIFELFTKFGHSIENWIDGWAETQEEAQEAFEELNNELSKTKSEIRNLEDQLETANERIEELMDQGSLTFVEQEELDKLKATTQELERQITLQETLKKSQQQGVNAASINATNKYLDTSFMSDKTKTERQEEAKETGSTIGKIAGGILGATLIALGVLGEGVTFGTSTGLIVLGAGMLGGGMVGGAIGSASAGAAYDSEQSVGEAMDSMLDTRTELKKAQDDALTENDVEAYNEATEALRTYDEQMAKHISQIQENYNAMDWETASPEDKQYMRDMADWLDAYSISMGVDGAKSNAIARIFGDEAQGSIAKARDEINRLKKNLAEARKSGKGVDEALAALEGFELNLSEEEVQRLRDMGIYLYEVEDYFKDVVKAESEFVDSGLEDVAKDINKITDGLDSLKTAFDEVIEGGVLTAKTILSLKDALGIGADDTKELTSAWSEYLKVMMSGAASTEEMVAVTEKLTQAWIEDALANDSLTPETEMEYIAQLRSLGVENAEEYVEDLLQKNMVEELEKGANTYRDTVKAAYEEATKDVYGPVESFDTFDDAKIEKLAEKYGISGGLYDEIKQDVMERYGVEEEAIDGIIAKLEEKKNLEQQIANAQDMKDAYLDFADKWRGALQDYQKLEKDLVNIYGYGKFTNKEKDFSESGWILSADGRKYVNMNQGKSMSKEAYEQLRARNQEYQKLINSDEYKEYKRLESELLELKKSEYGQHWVNDDLTLKDGVDENFAKRINALKEQIQSIETEIDTELTVDIELQLDLQNKSELVDDIQSVFDTLVNAQKEYDETGYISVDTLQTLLQLEPKYLDLLVDEQGNLNLTKGALYEVARARITDMGIQSQKNILEKANQLASKGSAEALREQITVMQAANEVGTDFVEVEMKKIKAILAEKVATGDLSQAEADAFVEGTMNQIKAVQVATQSALDNLNNSLSSSGNTAAADAEDALQKLMDYYDNRISANQAKYDQIQNDIDWLESQGKIADAGYYKDQIALLTQGEASKEALLEAKLQGAQNRLTELERAGQKGSEEWWEAAKVYNDTLSELDDVRDAVLDLQDAIGEIEWSKFEEFNSRLDDLHGKLETIRDLIAPNGEEDWFDDEGNWTEKGVAVLGSYVQDLNDFKAGLTEASDALDAFNEKSSYEGNEQWYADNYGIHSEQEYYDYLQKLTDEQYKYAQSVSDTEQDIAGMWESQVNAVEEYMDSLVEAYSDYIDNVKEALDAERDLYDFKKKIQKQTKDIASLERRIASLSGSTNAADIAERRKLEADLYESRESLNDEYNEHSKQSQQEALDAESQAYEEAMTRFVENLHTNLELALQDMDTFIAGVTSAVTVNAPTILGVYESLGVALDSAIVDPWQAAIDAMGEDGYSGDEGLGLMNSWVAEGGVFSTFASSATNYLISIWDDTNVDPGNAFANAVGDVVEGIVTNIQSNVETAKGYLNDLYDIRDTSTVYTGGGSGGGGSGGGGNQIPDPNVEALQRILKGVFYKNITVDGIWGTQTSEALLAVQKSIGANTTGKYDGNTASRITTIIRSRMNQSRKNGYDLDVEFYKKYLEMVPAAFHAKGTAGTTRDELAIDSEPWLGDELVLVPTAQGNLSYMRKGTGVVPADLTANLMEWGQFTPDSLKLGGGMNVNMINNAVIKPEFNFAFDALVKAENITEETLPAVKKLVTQELNRFTKELNYALKGKGAR